MDVPPGFDPTLILWLNLAGTFVFGLSGGLAAVQARLDVFGVIVLAGVVGLAGGITRDLLIGVPPATFRDWRYLAVVAAAGLVSFFAQPALERVGRGVQVFDAIGLSVFCVTGATKAVAAGLGPAPATLLGAITGIGGGMLRDVLLGETPTVLRRELYAIPALLGAAVAVAAEKSGSTSVLFPLLGGALCFAIRMIGLHRGIDAPRAPQGGLGDRVRRERRGDQHEQDHENRAGDDLGAPAGHRGEQDDDDRRPGDQPGRVELMEDVVHPQEAVEADRREQQAEHHKGGAEDVEDHENGPPRVT
jgi:uncharacterized membrane protein YeiH